MKRKHEDDDAEGANKRQKQENMFMSCPDMYGEVMVQAFCSEDVDLSRTGWSLAHTCQAAWSRFLWAVQESKRRFYDPRIAALRKAALEHKHGWDGEKRRIFPWPKGMPRCHETSAENDKGRVYRPLFMHWLRLDFPRPLSDDGVARIKENMSSIGTWVSDALVNGTVAGGPGIVFPLIAKTHPLVCAMRIPQISWRCADLQFGWLAAQTENHLADNAAAICFFLLYCRRLNSVPFSCEMVVEDMAYYTVLCLSSPDASIDEYRLTWNRTDAFYDRLDPVVFRLPLI